MGAWEARKAAREKRASAQKLKELQAKHCLAEAKDIDAQSDSTADTPHRDGGGSLLAYEKRLKEEAAHAAWQKEEDASWRSFREARKAEQATQKAAFCTELRFFLYSCRRCV